MLKIIYREESARDRSALFEILMKLSRILPERIMRSLWYRCLTGPTNIIKWGKRVKFEGTGILRFGPSLEVGDGVLFNLSDCGGADFGNKAFIITMRSSGRMVKGV